MADHKMQVVITALDDTQRAFANLKVALNQVQGELKGVGSASGGATTQVRGLGDAFSKMQGAFAAVGLSAIVSQLHQAGMAAEKLRNSFDIATGGATSGANAMAFVRGESNRLGLDLQNTAQAFLKLTASAKGTSLEGAKTQAIFSAVAGAGRALSLSSDEMNGALRAVSQMISKGTVQSEELRGQLGERLPGAFQIAARAMGVSTSELGKMLEQGKVVSDDFLPKFAAELQKTFPAGDKAVSGLTAETERLKTAWFDLKTTVMESGGEWAFTIALKAIKRDLESVKGIFTSIKELYQTIRHPFTNRGSSSKGQPLSATDTAMLGLGTGVDTTGTDWLFNNQKARPILTSQQISSDSSVVKDRSIQMDSKGEARAAAKATKDTQREAEAWRKAEADDIRDRYKYEQDQIKATQKEHDAWQKAELADAEERKKYAQQLLANKESALTLQSAKIAEQEAAGTITATEAMRQQVSVLEQKSALLAEQLTTLPKDTAGEVAAYNSQAEALAGVNTQLNSIQKSLRLREGWEGLKKGLEDYADAATNVGAQIQTAVGSAFKGMEDAIVNFTKTGKLSFNDMANAIIEDLIRITIRAQITGPLAAAMSGFNLAGMFGFAKGGAFEGGVQKFATGGIVMNPTYFGMASGMGLMGEAGPEAIMPLTRTASGHLGVRTDGGSQALNVQVNVVNQTSNPVKATSSAPQFDGKKFVINTILEDVSNNGPLRGLMAGGGAY